MTTSTRPDVATQLHEALRAFRHGATDVERRAGELALGMIVPTLVEHIVPQQQRAVFDLAAEVTSRVLIALVTRAPYAGNSPGEAMKFLQTVTRRAMLDELRGRAVDKALHKSISLHPEEDRPGPAVALSDEAWVPDGLGWEEARAWVVRIRALLLLLAGLDSRRLRTVRIFLDHRISGDDTEPELRGENDTLAAARARLHQDRKRGRENAEKVVLENPLAFTDSDRILLDKLLDKKALSETEMDDRPPTERSP